MSRHPTDGIDDGYRKVSDVAAGTAQPPIVAGWHILRVFAGNPLKVAGAINDTGLGTSYCPQEVEHRPHPFDKRATITVTKPLLPGYAFTDRPIELEQIGYALLAVSRARAEAKDRPNRPITNRTKVRYLTYDSHYLTLCGREMEKIRAAERAATHAPFVSQPSVQAIIQAFEDAVTAPLRTRFVALGDFQALAKFEGHGIYPPGRAA